MESILVNPVNAASASQVHPVETTAYPTIPESYQAWRALHHRLEFEKALDLYCYVDNIEGSSRAERLIECRQYAWFTRHKETGQVRVVSNACRLRWCPICAQARYMSIRSEVSRWLSQVRRPKFLTLTMRHSDTPLESQVASLYKHFRAFRQHRVISRLIRGGCWFFQLKRAKKTGQWHPHLHCLLDSNFIDKVKLSEEWRLTTGDSFIVDIRAVSDPKKVSDYVSRYCARPCQLKDFDQQDRITMFSVFHNKRLCGAFGTGRKISMRPRRCEDYVKWERFGSWSYVVTHRFSDAGCRAILKAFVTNTSISRQTILSSWPSPEHSAGPEDSQKTVIENRQMQWKEFM
jgi:hypothetical protein